MIYDQTEPVHKGMVLTLNDDEGNSVDYSIMDIIDYDGHIYVYFVKVDQLESDEQELYIMEYEETYQDIIFNSVTNEVLLNELYDVFMEENQEFDDEEEDDTTDTPLQD